MLREKGWSLEGSLTEYTGGFSSSGSSVNQSHLLSFRTLQMVMSISVASFLDSFLSLFSDRVQIWHFVIKAIVLKLFILNMCITYIMLNFEHEPKINVI